MCDKTMTKMRVYIAGSMTGKPDFNRTAFSLASIRLSAQGAIPLNPAMLPEGLSEADYMRIGLAMLQCAEGIYLLDGWQDSAGARAEYALAKKLGLACLFQTAHTAMPSADFTSVNEVFGQKGMTFEEAFKRCRTKHAEVLKSLADM
ncbi:DUF4406 domain-containing protein [Sodalis sp.]|uniref:DUF4406 domain-containing protein n=1 Tax=Sodalis sp. (in: enterobacteria) TaxID=1898979 RepID=UPI0038735B5F